MGGQARGRKRLVTLEEVSPARRTRTRLILQTQMEEFATCARVCGDCHEVSAEGRHAVRLGRGFIAQAYQSTAIHARKLARHNQPAQRFAARRTFDRADAAVVVGDDQDEQFRGLAVVHWTSLVHCMSSPRSGPPKAGSEL